ncbi:MULTISPECIES: phospholipase D family protein [unclassified Lentimonas]|uniref:phospholipase D family protein n=2 Tax=unclassified Lentimonas TaxID=2630993 RepID=UPI0013272D48|nr:MULTISPECIES: phospholipase D family protein [unclassified Lentimonas]CAA7183023.1 Cardiolipin synthetase (EC [Lentimonas sp. CC8]CAA6676812.1 Cardiolipin synthetase (EC [Lentimonas sp. CC4]CAA6686619.1 Cardiolipin synthetase (EC [Lentimonas sp. CC6]CAA7075804.1 Cardiolipin synthetase (EC [Lentimonas sp. CC4]CAA7168032.1 Cardiolipin synthetase (EC [Lentimonas sp. CC21]
MFQKSILQRATLWLSIFTLLLLCSCASVDFDTPKAESFALSDTQDTSLGQSALRMQSQHPAESGFYLLIDGIDSLATRIILAERAERSIDTQYYLISNDMVGYAFVHVLLRAADRGVRVRLLLDDIQTKGYDRGLAALDAHPNIEVRLFNPFARRDWRFFDGVTDYPRVNRRMHNKSFTVDNQVTLIGGRNMASEYFGANPAEDFGDLDVAGVGPVVGEVSSMFDAYWNNRSAVPIAGFTEVAEDPDAALLVLRERIEESYQELLQSPYVEALAPKITEIFGADGHGFTWAPSRLVYDSPDKAQKRLAKESELILTSLAESIETAEDHLVLISPYFVPTKPGVARLIEIQERGVEVIVVTNSLAANNQPIVHGGYAKSRKALLRAGVQLYEVSADATSGVEAAVPIGAKKGTLHAKAFVVDRKELFIGSFNFDPRSAYINTELGVIIESPEMAGHVLSLLEEKGPENTYEVYLDAKERLRWKRLEAGEWVVYDKEPNTGFWKRLTARVMGWLPIESQL